jgi:hypothetical protein
MPARRTLHKKGMVVALLTLALDNGLKGTDHLLWTSEGHSSHDRTSRRHRLKSATGEDWAQRPVQRAADMARTLEYPAYLASLARPELIPYRPYSTFFACLCCLP